MIGQAPEIAQKVPFQRPESDTYDPYKHNAWFIKQITKLKESAFDSYNQQDAQSVYETALKAQKLLVKEPQNLINLHYFYIDVVKWLHTLASYDLEADNLALKLCDADFEIYPKLELDKKTACPTATICCIILTRKQEYQTALNYCKFFIENGINERSGKSFEDRKIHLEKLILNNKNK